MLNPNLRSLYTTALSPPPGMVFDEAIATTFSLDPLTLLTIPAYLALLGNSGREGLIMDGVILLEALRRITARLTVYTQRGRMQAPRYPHILYGMLESMIVEVFAPRGGVFHPKLWVLRFVDPTGESKPILRLLVLSRNLTADRSWDLALQLEGSPTGRYHAGNRELGELLRALPSLSSGTVVSEERQEQAVRLADEVRRISFQPPPGFDSLSWRVLGVKRGAWQPPGSKRLAVMTPFCGKEALDMLCKSTTKPVALISLPETLSGLTPETRARFQQCLSLDEATENEDGEEIEGSVSVDTMGLHAKAYILEQGHNTHFVMGSANATKAALLAGLNVEVLVDLVGKRSKVGGIDDLLKGEGLGEVLVSFTPLGEEEDESQAALRPAEEILDKARDILAKAPLRVDCQPAEIDDMWSMAVVTTDCPVLQGLKTMKAWPLSVAQTYAVDAGSLWKKRRINLGEFSPQAVTGLIAFELTEATRDIQIRFALNLPVDGLPPDRDASILRSVIDNRDGFLRYLLLLLGEYDELNNVNGSQGIMGGTLWTGSSFTDFPLLEEMTRAFSRDPMRLQEVGKVVDKLLKDENSKSIIPPEFLELWKVFESALAARHES